MSLTLKEFRELTKDLPEDYTVETTIEFGNPTSIRGTVNQVHLCPAEHSYSDQSHITLTQRTDGGEGVKVRKLVGLNEWETVKE